ncbi:MAG TPA: hypothetical protein VHK91_08305 [Flavisolibacter sp.]|jgi:hypothetical protein|nr:hypothetical protein [Flavisolibacter sp.]
MNQEKNVRSEMRNDRRDENASLPNSDQGSKDGEYKNIETSVNNPSYFNDDFETDQEDAITDEEARTEDENQNTKKVRD